MLSEFQALIEQMMDDNAPENDYQELIKQNPTLVIEYEIQTISENPNTKLSNFSIILLSRLVSVLSENFISIGNQEFHEYILKSIFCFLSNPEFSSFSLSLISDLVSRIILVYSYSNEFDSNTTFFPLIMEIIQSPNIENSRAAIDTLSYCVYNESIDFNQESTLISDFLDNVFTTDDISLEILLPSLRLLYLIFESISFDFHSYLPNIFTQFKSDIESLNQTIHDIITYLPINRYSFFDENSTFFILYFSEILGSEDMPNDLEYCSLEILYNLSSVFYNDFANNNEIILDNIFLFLSNYGTYSKESKFIISKISEKYGAIYSFATHCYDIFEEELSKSSEEFPNLQIAAMKLFSYCYKGIVVVLSIELPDDILKIIIQSEVMENPDPSMRIVAFDLLNSIFKNLLTCSNTLHPMIIFQYMIESIENPDDPIVLVSKFKAFRHYLDCLSAKDLENVLPYFEGNLLELAENSTSEQLVYIFGCIEVFLNQLPSHNFDIFNEYLLSILKDPSTIPLDIYIMALQSSTYLTDISGDIFQHAFSFIMELDFEMMTGKDLNSLLISFYRICFKYPSYAFPIFPSILKFSIKGAMNDIEYSSIPFQKLTTMMNIHASVKKQNNIIKSYDGSQIQLIIFYLKVLRYALSIQAPMISDMIQEDAELIYNILLKWSSIDFSDKIQYNALKIVHLFLILTKYEFPFELLLELMMDFTQLETKESRLTNLYRFIFQIFLDTLNYDKMTEELMSAAVIFYDHELQKINQRREKICDQLDSGDCEVDSDNSRIIENALAMIWLPFLSNPSIDNSFFINLAELSMNNICVASISFLGHYYRYKEQNPDIIEYLINIFVASTDEEEKINCENPFFTLDSRYAALFLISFINDKILNFIEISNLINIFTQRTRITVNCSIYIAIVLSIASKYSDKFDFSMILTLLNRVDKLFYFDPAIAQLVDNIWNEIFPLLNQQSFDIDTLAHILGILSIIKDGEVADAQKDALLQNFQDDLDILDQTIENFISKQPLSQSDEEESG